MSAGSLTIKRQEYCTFTNSDGEVLKQLSNNVWAADRPFMWNGIDVGALQACPYMTLTCATEDTCQSRLQFEILPMQSCSCACLYLSARVACCMNMGGTFNAGGRMAVLRLSDGSIWVHSPVELDDALADALRELGDVKHIVSPNYEHTKYAQQVQ